MHYISVLYLSWHLICIGSFLLIHYFIYSLKDLNEMSLKVVSLTKLFFRNYGGVDTPKWNVYIACQADVQIQLG